MNTVFEIWADTGKSVERPLTPDEQKQRDADEKAAADARKTAEAKAKEDQAARAAAIDHAKSLGFTDAMIAVMYPNLGNGDATE